MSNKNNIANKENHIKSITISHKLITHYTSHKIKQTKQIKQTTHQMFFNNLKAKPLIPSVQFSPNG